MNKFLYAFSYDNTESELCKLESSCIFNDVDKNKLLFSDIKFEPAHSAFIKNRLEIISTDSDYNTLIRKIKDENICIEGFKVEYIVFEEDTTGYKERLNKLKDIGYSIEGTPDYYHPTTTYALCYYEKQWCFGLLVKNKFAWQKHNKKPFSFSNSIGINIAKALVNIASKGNKNKTLLDVCCGVGTIMLEACFAGNNIEGCDINWKVCRDTRENLAYFNYTAKVYRSDIKDIDKRYDAAIVDLPYDLFSFASENDISHILHSTSKITNRLVIVSTTDITSLINQTGFKISAHCNVKKPGKSNFSRRIWVCNRH